MSNPAPVCPHCHQPLGEAGGGAATACPKCGGALESVTGAPSAPGLSRFLALQVVLRLDAAVLFLLGALLILAPRQVEVAFKFRELPLGANYILGMWGCLLVTMALGYLVAARNPIRHLVWVQVGIARGLLECMVGLAYVARGTVNLEQARAGLLLAAAFSVAYAILYPRGPRLVQGATGAPGTR